MIAARQISMITAITIWAAMTGGVLYSHIVYFPAYLSHLPESNQLITGEYGLHDSNFWMFIHPLAILSTAIALVLNWKLKARRKFILTTAVIYVAALIATATFFLPELMTFADSTTITGVSSAEWFERGQTWQYLSWMRGFLIGTGFISLLFALSKNPNTENE